jgi:hypothetical protein
MYEGGSVPGSGFICSSSLTSSSSPILSRHMVKAERSFETHWGSEHFQTIACGSRVGLLRIGEGNAGGRHVILGYMFLNTANLNAENERRNERVTSLVSIIDMPNTRAAGPGHAKYR